MKLRRWPTSTAMVAAAVLASAALAACGPVRIISPYDEVIDRGLQDYKFGVNLLVTEAGKSAGAPDGAFEAFKNRYTELEVKLEMLIDRARIDEINDVSCKLDSKTASEIKARFAEALQVLPTGGAPASATGSGGCMVLLLENAKKQLRAVEQIHSTPAMCAWPGQPTLTCIRPAAAESALSATNQSLDAALLVESAKRKGEVQ